jgi:hypothetical protein
MIDNSTRKKVFGGHGRALAFTFQHQRSGSRIRCPFVVVVHLQAVVPAFSSFVFAVQLNSWRLALRFQGLFR